MNSPLIWSPRQAPPTLIHALREVSSYAPDRLRERESEETLTFRQQQGLRGPKVEISDGRSVIHYSSIPQALRGIGSLWAGLATPGSPLEESLPLQRMGVMLDCSRNAVIRPDHVKRWMLQLALLGYNEFMLYTEDTYEVPGEPYFGYLRGRYTEEELRALDAYAAELDIELTACIQTLGHLEHLLKWSAYREIKDTSRVLMVDAERTYALLDAMLGVYARSYRSRRILIGMDETHDLGRGVYMDRHGYERGYDLFQRHLGRVLALCEKHGLKPMIWSDMYFRLGNANQDYYDPKTQIPDSVKSSIPGEVDLIYWDYYHEDQEFYEDWLQRHRDLGHPAIMASGVWTWGGLFWYWHEKTVKTVTPCLEACREQGVRDVIFTLWGDDGAFCELDSALAGLAYAAECAFHGKNGVQMDHLAARFLATLGVDYHAVCRASEIQKDVMPAVLFWDDPLLGIYWKNEALKNPGIWQQVERQYGRLQRSLAEWKTMEEPVDFAHWHTVVGYLRKTIKLKSDLERAYSARDTRELERIEAKARKMPAELERCNQSFRRQWLRRNRPNGLETLQNRIGARKQRWIELAQRLRELREGTVENIPELEEIAPFSVDVQGKWSAVAASGIL